MARCVPKTQMPQNVPNLVEAFLFYMTTYALSFYNRCAVVKIFENLSILTIFAPLVRPCGCINPDCTIFMPPPPLLVPKVLYTKFQNK